jgi:hypothetical protein
MATIYKSGVTTLKQMAEQKAKKIAKAGEKPVKKQPKKKT